MIIIHMTWYSIISLYLSELSKTCIDRVCSVIGTRERWNLCHKWFKTCSSSFDIKYLWLRLWLIIINDYNWLYPMIMIKWNKNESTLDHKFDVWLNDRNEKLNLLKRKDNWDKKYFFQIKKIISKICLNYLITHVCLYLPNDNFWL